MGKIALTKMDMAKVIVTALYHLPELATEENKIAWKHAKQLARLPKEGLQSDYERACKILNERVS